MTVNWSTSELRDVVRSMQSQTDDDLPEGMLVNDPSGILAGEPLNNPFVTYLFKDEQIQVAGTDMVMIVEGEGINVELNIESGAKTSVYAFTDKRFLIVTGSTGCDSLYSIPYSNIVEYSVSSGGIISSSKCEFRTSNNEYKITEAINDRVKKLFETNKGENLPEVSIDCESVIVCTKCHEKVGRDAEKCPHCGYFPDDRTTIAAIKNHPVGVCAGYEYIEIENSPSKLEWFETESIVSSNGNSQNSSQQYTTDQPEDRLRKLKQLYDDDLLSEDEYENKKKDILDEL